MHMIHISQVLPLIDKQLKQMHPKEVVQFKTFKKDRGFMIYRANAEQFQLVENGFNNASFAGDADKIKKQAKKSLKREFPRSNKVWVEYFQEVDCPLDIKPHHSKQMSLF
ncbi:hypothetical protein [Photobacterium sp. DNB22_13_2]